ncbi:MAG: acyltransferase family protein [Bacilli bacterium]
MSKPKKKITERITVIDLMKLVGMLFICIAHCLQRWGYTSYVSNLGFAIFYSVALPLFFFSSGLLLKRAKTLKELLIYIGKTICLYLIPAYGFSVLSIYTLPRFVLEHKDFAYWMNELYLRTDTFYWHFLVAAFINIFLAIFSYVFSLIKKEGLLWDVLKSVFLVIVSIGYLMIFSYISNREDLGPGCLAANMVLYYLPITLFAFIFKTFMPYLKKIPQLKILKAVGALLCLVVYLYILLTNTNWLPKLGGTNREIATLWFGSLTGTLVYFYLLSLIDKYEPVKKISSLGRYSGQFYLVHVYIIRLFATYIKRPEVFDGYAMMYVTFLTIIFTVGSLFVTILLCFFPLTDLILFLNYRRIHDLIYPKQWIKAISSKTKKK